MRTPAKLVVAATIGLSTLLSTAPASAAVYVKTCPSGYEGVIVGTPWGEFYVCQNIVKK